MTFNIRYNTDEDGENAWPKRRELFFKTIEMFNPDLLGLQEVKTDQGQEIKERLKEYEMIGQPRDESPRAERSSVMFKRDRFEMVRGGTFWLSETPDEAGSKGWDGVFPRVCTWVELRDRKSDGRTLFYFNTHWDHKGAKAREESAKLMRRKVDELAGDKPVIITGDFNAPQNTKPYTTLLGDKFTEAFLDAHPRPTTQDYTFHSFTGHNTHAVRIDWVLRSKDFITKSAAINRTNENGRYPSDHFPVEAVFGWKN